MVVVVLQGRKEQGQAHPATRVPRGTAVSRRLSLHQTLLLPHCLLSARLSLLPPRHDENGRGEKQRSELRISGCARVNLTTALWSDLVAGLTCQSLAPTLDLALPTGQGVVVVPDSNKSGARETENGPPATQERRRASGRME